MTADLKLGRDYLTRRIRHHVYGHELEDVFEKQIVVPLAIPSELEQYLQQYLSDILGDLGLRNGRLEKILIPIHESGKGTHVIPDLYDTINRPNLRHWVMSNELMWEGLDRR